ncbi:hypothetical protein EXS70_03420 [Candidatus Peribacteria bacterium]|nr:hypothetical protein [Candidatus Peribacteria bacterium]
MRSRLLTLIAVAGLLAPITGIAQSYMTPEQVLDQNNGAFLIPGHQRGARWMADFEAQLSRDRHPAIITDPWEQEQIRLSQPPPVVFDDEGSFGQDYGQANPYSNLDPTTARLLARLAQQNSILASSLGNSRTSLAQTGPAAILIVIVMAIATFLTIRKAKMLEKFVKEI